MTSFRDRGARGALLFAFAAAVLSVAACGEQLDGSVGCPLVCPQEQLPLRDTLIDAIIVDSSIAGFPPIGYESDLLLSTRGDTSDTRLVARWDSLPTKAHQSGVTVDSVITNLDSVELVLPLESADSLKRPIHAFSLEVYDVSAVSDTNRTALLAQFTDANRIATRSYANADSSFLHVPMPKALILDYILKKKPFRAAVRLVADTSLQLRIVSKQVASGPYLRIDVFKNDSLTPDLIVPTVSTFPSNQDFTAAALSDYTLQVKGPAAPTADVIRVGGFPWRRIYIKLDIPRRILDSSIVVRASLILTQKPLPFSPAAGDTVIVTPHPILASSFVTDLHRLLEFAGPTSSFSVDSVFVMPKEGAVRTIQIGGLVRAWTGTDPVVTPRVLALRINTEGAFPNAVDFYSREAAANLRPKLRITYVPQTSFGPP